MRIVIACLLAVLAACSSGNGGGHKTDAGPGKDIAAEVAAGEIAQPVDTTPVDTVPEVAAACNPVGNKGCEEGTHCEYDFNNKGEPICVKNGTAEVGQDCGGVDSCMEGMCLGGEGEQSKCFAACETGDDCETNVCIPARVGDFEFGMCALTGIEECNLLEQGCPEGQGCYFDQNYQKPICAKAGTVEPGGSCGAAQCVPGYACMKDKGGQLFCAKLCNKDAPECEQGEVCQNYFGKQKAGTCMPE